jgi:glycosyltransferase involved in cell wall biosynthesis
MEERREDDVINRIGIFLFVKNEVDFIEKWLDHNLQIADETTVIDNGSTDGTLEILKAREGKIRLVEDGCRFGQKGRICLDWIQKSKANLVLPLDADELPVFDDGHKAEGDPKRAREYLIGLPVRANDKFRVRKTYTKHTEPGWWGVADSNKRFFAKDGLVGLDCGSHTGRTEGGGPPKKSNISYLHYHFRSKEAWEKSTEQKLKARLGRKWNDLAFLSGYTGPSFHSAREYVAYKTRGIWNWTGKEMFDDDLGR